MRSADQPVAHIAVERLRGEMWVRSRHAGALNWVVDPRSTPRPFESADALWAELRGRRGRRRDTYCSGLHRSFAIRASLVDPLAFTMTHAMLLTLKSRAEGRRGSRAAASFPRQTVDAAYRSGIPALFAFSSFIQSS